MALSPNIPTSFVPKQSTPSTRYRTSGANVFLVPALILLAVSILGAGATFGYQSYLQAVQTKKEADLKKQQGLVDLGAVQDLVRLRDRLTAAQLILNNHVAASQFFIVLEMITLQNVRFSSLTLTIAGDHSARISMGGTARTFNALAAQSQSFATEKRIKSAIFSGIKANSDGTVAFTLTANVDPSLLIQSVPAAAPAAGTATSSTP